MRTGDNFQTFAYCSRTVNKSLNMLGNNTFFWGWEKDLKCSTFYYIEKLFLHKEKKVFNHLHFQVAPGPSS